MLVVKCGNQEASINIEEMYSNYKNKTHKITELREKQDKVNEIDKNIVKELIETELSQSIDGIFKELDFLTYSSS